MIDITTQRAFEELCCLCEKQPFLAIDTEFIRERTFYPKLALVQIAWPDSEPILIDPLEISDWSPLHRILMNEDIIKVFHAGRQDIEIFYLQMGTIPVNIYDTQIAASFLGHGEQIGYGNLVLKILGLEIQKGDSYTNWLKRPLTANQISYARNDVLYLVPAYEKLIQNAEQCGRTSWIKQEIESIYSDNLYDPDEEDLWKKVKKSNSLRQIKLSVLQELSIWRYHVAKQMDKPVRFIVRDEVLISISHRQQLKEDGIEQIRGFPQAFRKQFGKGLVDAFERGRNKPSDQWPRQTDRPTKYADHIEIIAELAWVLVKETAAKENLAPSLFLSKKQLSPLVASAIAGKLDNLEILHGWRQEIIGSKLKALLEGELALLVKDGQLAFLPFNQESDAPIGWESS